MPRSCSALLLFFGLLCPSPVLPQSAGEPDDVLAVAHRYLDTLYRFDFEALERVAAEDIVFEDPTSVYFGSPSWHFESRDELVDFFAGATEGLDSMHFEVVREFATADRAVLTLVYVSEGDGANVGVPGVPLTLRVPAVTVLHVVDGRVVHHLDHVDYESMMEQVRAQTEAAETSPATSPE